MFFKTIILLLYFMSTFISIAQVVEYESIELNRIVWDKINDNLEKIGKSKIAVFDTSYMYDFSRKVCLRLIEKDAIFSHSDNDSISKYSGGECILSYIRNYSDYNDIKLLKFLLKDNLEAIAEVIVKGWLNSDDHREAISSDWYISTCVYVIIRYDKKEGYFKLVAAWHQKNKFFGNLIEKN